MSYISIKLIYTHRKLIYTHIYMFTFTQLILIIHRFRICRFVYLLKCICEPRPTIAGLPVTLNVRGGEDTRVLCHARSRLRLSERRSAFLFWLRLLSSFLFAAYLVSRVWHFVGFAGDSLCKMTPAWSRSVSSVSEPKKAAMGLTEEMCAG